MREIPRWGRVTANANEFLIQMRRGKVVRSGQGLSCFKWPWDSVAVVPTSIAKLTFSADQVTVEKVGVEVRGLAVYRIADPLLAFRMIDVDRSSLTEILRDMFVGATRRIVARLTLDECITHRKDLVAQALMGEIAPILAGEGSMNGVKQERARLDAERRRVEEQSASRPSSHGSAARRRPIESAPPSSSKRSAKRVRPTRRSCGSPAPRTSTSAKRGSARCSSPRRCPRWRAPSAARSIA